MRLRKKYLLSPRFQLKYALLFFAIGALVAATVGVMAFFFFRDTYQAFLNASFHQPPELVQNLESAQDPDAGHDSSACGVSGATVLGIWITHRCRSASAVPDDGRFRAARFCPLEISRRDEFQEIVGLQ